MLGAIIGDIVGSTREWQNVKTTNFEFVPAGSRFTDDTVMTLAVAEWLMTDSEHRPETLVACMQQLGRRYPRAGYGGMFARWLGSNHPQPYGSFGNGSAMRVSPVGLYACSLDEALELARITASVTHNHPEGIKGAQAIAACIYLKRQAGNDALRQIEAFVTQKIGYNLDFRLDDLRPYYKFDVTCQGSVPVAIKAFLEGYRHSAEQALRLAISMGGDSDTIGDMTAAIAAAQPVGAEKGGFSAKLVAQCRSLLPVDLLDINDRFEAFVSRQHYQSYQVDKQCFASKHSRATGKVDAQKSLQQQRALDRIRGSLMCGAVGDALGYPVEFMSREQILARYGRRGITTFDLAPNGKALVSDDTQMTLFTANGLLAGLTQRSRCSTSVGIEAYVRGAYIDWYYTQTCREQQEGANPVRHTWLRDLPELAHRRAPGITCLSACESLLRGEEVCNNSKGCGGIMRVASLALYQAGRAACDCSPCNLVSMCKVGAHIAAETHKHPLGFLPAALLTHLIYRLVGMERAAIREHLAAIALETLDTLHNLYPGVYDDDKNVLEHLTRLAVKLAANTCSDADNICQLGQGWTAEETWAIALYCAVRHVDHLDEALIAAVNHDGDSDSTGAVCGNIMGAIWGYAEMKRRRLCCPQGKELEQTLELANLILTLADDLYSGCMVQPCNAPIETQAKQQWMDRYVNMKPVGL